MTGQKNELIGNFEIAEGGVVSRRDVLLMGAIAAGTVLAAGEVKAAVTPTATEPYVARDFSELVSKKLDGLSQSQIEQHLKLYKGYIGKSNEIFNKLKEVDITTANATYSPLRELLLEQSYAVNGAIYHEYYFGNLGGKGGDPSGDLKAALDERWGTTGKFIDFFKAAGKSMRGWVVVGYNTRGGHLDFFGLDMHNMWVPANMVPIVVLDVYEHAYMVDYGIDRAKYLDAFFKIVDWDVVAKRLSLAHKHASGLDSTT
jgi:superoxide dismutase, Fe-Mn family